MEEDFLNYLPTVMFRGTPCISPYSFSPALSFSWKSLIFKNRIEKFVLQGKNIIIPFSFMIQELFSNFFFEIFIEQTAIARNCLLKSTYFVCFPNNLFSKFSNVHKSTTVSVNSSDPPCKDGNVRFTMVPFKQIMTKGLI